MKYSEMTLEELDKAKYAFNDEERALREVLRNVPDEERAAQAELLRTTQDRLLAIRAEKLAIQKAQEALIPSLPDPNAHVIGATSILSQEKVAGLGGSKKK